MTRELLMGRLLEARSMTLFLDYDGTLAEFAPTPDHVEPNREVVELLGRLAASPRVTALVLSGRRLSAVERLLPVRGITLAGSYGIEVRTAAGARVERLSRAEVRPLLDRLKPLWVELVASGEGFFLEDKEWSLALHARYAAPGEAARVLAGARKVAADLGVPDDFRLAGDSQFLEVAPRTANKREGVEYLLALLSGREAGNSSPGSPPPRSGPVVARSAPPLPSEQVASPAVLAYFGDDERDREAFTAIRERGGYTALVGGRGAGDADCRFPHPAALRGWLRVLTDRL